MRWFEKMPGSPLRYGPRGMVLGVVTVLDGLIGFLSLGLYQSQLWMVYFEWESGVMRKRRRIRAEISEIRAGDGPGSSETREDP